MAIPPTAVKFAGTLDPQEELDFAINCVGLLEAGETIASYTLTVLAEAVALGLTIMSGGGRNHALNDSDAGIDLWLTIAPGFQANAAFDGAGTPLPLHVQFETDSSPARTRERTFLVQVAQQ